MVKDKTRKKELAMNYRIIAISKSTNGSVQYAIISSMTGFVEAIATASSDAGIYHVVFVRATTPIEQKWVLEYIDNESRKGGFNL